jgi:hypothetical protein
VARITSSVYTSHVPAVGAAIDLGKTAEPYWANVFRGYEFSKQWEHEHRPDVIFLVAVHPLRSRADGAGLDAPLGPQLASSPSALAEAFGIPAVVVDGTSADAVAAAVRDAKAAKGPSLIEARLESK